MREKVLILHYLTLARGTPAFAKRTVDPLLGHFGKEPYRLLDTARKLGGHRADYGDVAVTINVFPSVAITLVLWRGDAEFAPSASTIFDASITDYLSTEDITVLCETVIWKLVKSLGQD